MSGLQGLVSHKTQYVNEKMTLRYSVSELQCERMKDKRNKKQNKKKTNKCLLSYQTGVAVIKAKLSGYIPVCVIFNDGHIRVFDGATEMVKLELQTRGLLHCWRKQWKRKRSFKVITAIKERCLCRWVIKWDNRLGWLHRGGLKSSSETPQVVTSLIKTGSWGLEVSRRRKRETNL